VIFLKSNPLWFIETLISFIRAYVSGENTQAATWGDSSKLQSDLNFAFDQRESEVNLHKATTLVVIGTDCIGSCKSNYHKITTTMTPNCHWKII
jgi:hypothetical protein